MFPNIDARIRTLLLPLHVRYALAVDYTIEYYSAAVEEQILTLSHKLAARYIVLTRGMTAVGANLGPRHTDSFGDGLFELRLKSAEGFALGHYPRNAAACTTGRVLSGTP